MKWETIPVRHELRNGLKLEAQKQRRSIASLVEYILVKEGVQIMSDSELATYLENKKEVSL
ncbi:MAG: hypothetical protein ACPKPY_09785 [Nitrososphaeraceae archaeon]